ncbi:MAG: DUF202 domain-containing protein [Planctomycetes bacterium]|nr:DUF202 domain-containing protein [Planctomycetota bacterium]
MKKKSDSDSCSDRREIILRDTLAAGRTVLANERTLLAYIRTALALLLTGATFIHFSRAEWFTLLGVVCLVGGVLAFVLGFVRYCRMRSIFTSIDAPHRTSSNDEADPSEGR